MPSPGTRVDEERVVDRARRLGHRVRRGDRQPVGRADDEVVEAVQRIERGGHATGLPAAPVASSTSSEMPRSVSNTPAPCSASAEKLGTAAEVERVVQLVLGQDQLARQVLLVVLDHERQLADVDALLQQVGVQVLQALDVLVELARLAVGHEHDAVGALEHELARGVVVDLAGHGVELEPGA